MPVVKRSSEFPHKSNGLDLQDYHHVEIYVGNARQATHFYRTAFGFTPVAYRGLETGDRNSTSIVLKQGEIYLIVTEALRPDSEVAEHVKNHGEDVKDIAFIVDDVESAYRMAIERGARSVLPPTTFEDQYGSAVKATIGAFGETVHSFINRDSYGGVFFPGFKPLVHSKSAVTTGLTRIDHVAVSVGATEFDELIDFYIDVLGFEHSYSEDVLTEYSAMNSKVVQNGSGSIKFPIIAPAPGKRTSQIEEYLAFHNGPGAQHIAVACDDIVRTVRTLRENGTEFLSTIETYYHMLNDRVGFIEESVDDLRELNVLVDRDEKGYLMQIFTKPLLNRPTVFLEVIQRKGAQGFGGGNIKALFEAVEREQLLRGNL
jgi:4-hydroxyphenylpyruvate dioxygenase